MNWISSLILATLCAWGVSVTNGVAQDLHDSIADPYTAYTQAMEAEDYEAARVAARQAWDAAETVGLDAETMAILADNYAQLAQALGDPAEALRAYERTAELLDDSGASAAMLADTWVLAAAAALTANEPRRAARHANTAGGLAESIDTLSVRDKARLVFISRALQAHALWHDARLRQSNSRAVEALELAEAHDLADSPYYALLTFIHGAWSAIDGNDQEAAFWLTKAYARIPEQRRALHYWVRLARSRLSEAEAEALIDRIAQAGVQVIERADETDDSPDYDAVEGFTDAAPANRTPPRYPEAAQRGGFEGVTVIKFTVNERGRTEDLEVLLSVPFTAFGEAGVAAIERWRYQPATINGEPTRREGMVMQFQFALED